MSADSRGYIQRLDGTTFTYGQCGAGRIDGLGCKARGELEITHYDRLGLCQDCINKQQQKLSLAEAVAEKSGVSVGAIKRIFDL